jgi:hypothetical protein
MSKQRNIDHTTDGSITTPRTDISGIPKFGWRVNFDYECKEKCDPFTKQWPIIPFDVSRDFIISKEILV